MNSRQWMLILAAWLLVAAIAGTDRPAPAAESAAAKILIIAGPCQHPPGTHEAAAGARLIGHLVANSQNVKPARAEVLDDWPKDKQALADVRTVVFLGDIFPPEKMDDPARVKAELAELMDRGCGLVCIHYATGLRAQDVAEDGDHPLLKWLGGYFATGCKHHRSIARVLTATITPAPGDHPALRGFKEFTFDDEPYWNNYFGKDGPAENVTPLATSMLPPDKPKPEIVAWAVDRADGGRGMGIVLPHYFRNWRIGELRTLVLNGIFWTAKVEIPVEGVKAPLPDLSAFNPESLDPRPRPKQE